MSREVYPNVVERRAISIHRHSARGALHLLANSMTNHTRFSTWKKFLAGCEGFRIARNGLPSTGKRQRTDRQFTGRVVLFSAGIVFLPPAEVLPTEPPMSVYVMDEFARVRPGDAPVPSMSPVLRAARNEYAPFQIVVRAGTGGLKRVNAVAGPLMPKRGHSHCGRPDHPIPRAFHRSQEIEPQVQECARLVSRRSDPVPRPEHG